MPRSSHETLATDDGAAVVEKLNRFLCEEIAASQAYRVTADRVAAGPEAVYVGLLRQFEEEHDLAAQTIRDQILEIGGETADQCGEWGAWADARQCDKAGLFDAAGGQDASPLQCLKRGELHNLEHYIDGVDGIDADSAQLLRNQLIPAQQRHVRMLEELLGREAGA